MISPSLYSLDLLSTFFSYPPLSTYSLLSTFSLSPRPLAPLRGFCYNTIDLTVKEGSSVMRRRTFAMNGGKRFPPLVL